MNLTIVIVNYNTKDLLISCLESIYKNTKNLMFEVVVVDNGSADGSSQEIKKQQKKHKNLKLVASLKNNGYAAGNNLGIKAAKGKYVLLLNSDTLVTSNVLKELFDWMDDNPEVGISSCMLKNKDGSIQGTGGYFPNLLRVFSWMTIQDIPGVDYIIKPFHPMRPKSLSKGENFYKQEKEMDWATGAFFFMRKDMIKQVGLLDEDYFMYVEELDYCFRAKKKGWKVWYLPDWEVIHLGGASSTNEFALLSEYKGIKRFYKKHYPIWQFPILRLLLKIGALGRMLLFSILEGTRSGKIYAKAFLSA